MCVYEVLDSEWEVTDEAIVTKVELKLLLHHL